MRSEGEDRKVWCRECKNRVPIPGDCHISCKDPPPGETRIGAGGDERYRIAARLAKETGTVVRCVWPESGIYPFGFDENTVFACPHFVPIGKGCGEVDEGKVRK